MGMFRSLTMILEKSNSSCSFLFLFVSWIHMTCKCRGFIAAKEKQNKKKNLMNLEG